MFVNEENIPMVHQDEEDYDYYKTPDTSRVEDETSFTTEPTSTLWQRQKLTRDKIVSLYRYLGVTGDPGLADLDRFMIKKIQNQVILNCFSSLGIINGNPLLINVLVNF